MKPRYALDPRTYVVWGVGLSVYFLSVLHRSSMAVAGIVAQDRFGITASQLAFFVMLQLLVYSLAQIPVGLLLDRFGSRRLLTAGLLLLTIAQMGFALSETFAQALLFRALVGAGDSLIFVSVLRLVTMWFDPRGIPIFSQITGTMGQMGGVVAAIPMTWAFANYGWTTTYIAIASVNVIFLIGLLIGVHDAPGTKRYSGPNLSLTRARENIRDAWAHPGTRLGFWTHVSTHFSATSLGLLWGFPYLVRGENLSEQMASSLLTLLILAVIVSGPFLGFASARFAYHRSTVILSVVATVVIVWTLVLSWPGDAPIWLLAILMVVVGVAGPTSLIGLDYGRAFNPVHRMGVAVGVINQGGYYASLVLIIAIGVILDWRTGGGAYTPSAFVWALSFQYVIWTVGVIQIWRYRQLTRARVLQDATE